MVNVDLSKGFGIELSEIAKPFKPSFLPSSNGYKISAFKDET